MWMTRVSIQNPVFATMVMVALCVLGLFSYSKLGVEQMPDISFPGAQVDVRYPGASPEAVEREIAKPLEEALNTIAGVERIQSRSFEGRVQASVEFSLNADMGRAMQDLRDRVAAAQARFPRDAKPPTVQRFENDNSQPVVVMALLSPTRGSRELSMMADLIVSKRLGRVEGVAKVDVGGMTTREVRIDLDPMRLRAYGVTPAEIAKALAEANTDQPVGLLSDQTSDAILRVEGRVKDPKAFGQTVVARRGNLALTLNDLGTLVEREREQDSIARINGQPAVSFNIFKQQDANIVKTGDAVKEAMDELRKTLPKDVELRLIYAASDFVKGSLTGLQHTLIEGALLTVAIVFLFLHSWRSTIITGLTLPIAVISSFIAVHAFGFTLNFMTMMALSLCIGLLIDDAIVVRENIVRHVGMGKDHRTASFDGTNEIGLAVMATTFAICAVFVPVAFMGGIIGKFFYPFGITVAVAVLVSLFVSFTLDPMLSSVWHDPPSTRIKHWPVIGHLIRATDWGMDRLHDLYARTIDWAFSGRRYRVFVPPIPAYGRPFSADGQRDKGAKRRLRFATLTPRGLVMWGAFASFVAALALAPMVGSEFVPQTDNGFTQVNLRMPVASSIERGSAKVAQIEEILKAYPEIKTVSTVVGSTGEGMATGRNQASLNITLTDRSERKRTQKEVEDSIRADIAKIPGIEVSVGFDRPIWITLLGNDPEVLTQAAKDLVEQIKKIPGAVDVDTTVKPGLPAFAVRLKDSAIRELGLTAPQIASSLRAYVNGEIATYWTTPDGNQVEVLLRLPREQRERIEQMAKLPVAFSATGAPITLDQVATIEPVFNPEVIRRENLQRREAVFAGVQGRPGGDVNADVQKLIKNTQLPPGTSFKVDGAGKQQAEAFNGLLAAMALAAIFIYIVLASQFGSFLQPIAIMASLPLALIGVMLALLLWRSTLNVFSMIGLVMLMGLVTKNAILLVDFANHARKAGATVAEALREAGLIRMRPIIMTTAAMVFGMLPMAIALNDGGEIQAPMGRAIIGGVITSTLLTLVVVPVLYSYLVREKKPAKKAAEQGGGALPLHGMPGAMPADKE
ncbi:MULTISPECIES: efflux RND transporter permease subunit [unclassified Roseateles]|uniref:efflux RND transporter permease subunit n=1 Tax=unclassified Roseateles TaxID=2626991 RepID=UPI0006F203AF|nr:MULTISPECIES: efflux RND transporter permease subunit [unclassified Roseateles]KQW43666.1 nodulation protein NolG [Pelomonas sp. Root405]KRA71404.1 nodulation protein NolG [Pelomonas sp. Root662]